jgi:subtilisin family serine protease
MPKSSYRSPIILRSGLVLLLIALLTMPARAAVPAAGAHSGGLLVKYRTDAAAARPELPAQASPATRLSRNRVIIRVPAGREDAYLAQLQRDPRVVYAQRDHIVAAQDLPDDPRYGEQWHLERIGMPAVWSVITSTMATPIAILDTGARTDHPDLAGNLWTNAGEVPNNGQDDDGNGYIDDIHGMRFFHTYSGGQAYPQVNPDVNDDNGHGTHVAGIAGAVGNNTTGVSGVSWKARLMIVRVLDESALGWESDIIQGLEYAVDNGARVINMSLGQADPSPALSEAIDYAEAHGVVVIAASGNQGGALLYPAAYPSVLAVGASDQSDQRASFSAYGPQLDLLAPGVSLLSTWPGVPYFTKSGTSMAAPQVTATAALLRSLRPNLSPAQIRFCIAVSAADLGPPGRDDLTGWGRLDAARALRPCPSTLYLPTILAF